MTEDRQTELLLDLSSKVSAIQKDLEYLKNSNDANSTNFKELLDERTKWAANRQDAVKAEMQGQIDVIKKSIELSGKERELLDSRIKAVEKEIAIVKEKNLCERMDAVEIDIRALKDKDKNKIYSRYEQVKDKLFLIAVGVGFAAIFYYIIQIIKKAIESGASA